MPDPKQSFAGYSDAVFQAVGGMAEVFRAVKTATGERVALKLPLVGQEERLEQEYDILCRLSHPGLVMPQHCGMLGGRPYLESPWIDGKNLQTLTDSCRDSYYWRSELQSKEVILHVGIALLSIVAYLHSQDIVHRDVSLDNIMLTVEGELKLIDFGVAVEYTGAQLKTRIGKFGYVAPEVEEGKGVPQSDVFSVGKALYALGGSDETPPVHLEPRLKEVLARLLIRAPQQRPDAGTALQLLQALADPDAIERARSTLRLALRQLGSLGGVEISDTMASHERRVRRYLLVSLAMLAVLAGAAAVGWHESHTAREAPDLEHRF
jgi:serine/threonine protein kinase